MLSIIFFHIRRKVPEDKKGKLTSLINQVRSITMGTTGYISGKALKRLDKPGVIVVVKKWQSIFYWNQWFQSEERSKVQHKIDQLLGEETQYKIYEHD
jgi:heme-degrading monooxygenase HmoA